MPVYKDTPKNKMPDGTIMKDSDMKKKTGY